MSTPTQGVIVCFRRCWSCMFNQCPGGWHTWADHEDIEAAASAGLPDPSGNKCGCPCTDEPELRDEYPPGIDDELDAPPCPTCGESGACGYDSQGRALIHADWEQREDDPTADPAEVAP